VQHGAGTVEDTLPANSAMSETCPWIRVSYGCRRHRIGFVDGHGVGCSPAAPRYSIDFAQCPGSAVAQCGTLRVPANWSHPKGRKISVAVARDPADDPSHRIGTLFFNPGGPGDGAVKYVIAADTFFSETLRARFDVVGVDPRGVGGSTPITCATRRCVSPWACEGGWLGLSYGTQLDALYVQLHPRHTGVTALPTVRCGGKTRPPSTTHSSCVPRNIQFPSRVPCVL